MIADTEAGLRTFRVDRMTSVEPTGERVVRPDGFELEEAWRMISDEVEQRRTPYHARGLATPHALHICRWVFGNRVGIGPTGPDGRVEVELRGHNVHSLAGEVASIGAELEIVEPIELRERIAELAADLVALYR
jgi:predicted DNA-binding transcriptional regulator YafY